MESNFYLQVCIDCEATQHSINDPELGKRAVNGLLEVLADQGLLGTLFVIPGDMKSSPELYRQAAQSGHEVGLHVHPADQGYEEFLGIYGPEDQRRIIDEAADHFAQEMGHRPKSICIGYGSANDHTYAVLVELGFTHGHISIPTRILPECASVWAGAPFDTHYVHPYNRVLPGWLDFVEIPQTLDPESRMWGGKHPQDLRVELVDARNHWYTIAKAVDRQLRENVPVRYIQICTHNTFDYSDSRNFRRETLQKMIKHTKDIVASKDGTVGSATLEQLAVEFRRKCPIKTAKEFKLELDKRGRSSS